MLTLMGLSPVIGPVQVGSLCYIAPAPLGGSGVRDPVEPLKRLHPFKSGRNKFLDYPFVSMDFEQTPADGDLAVIEQAGGRSQVMEVAESVSGDQVELGIFKELTLNSNNFLNGLIVCSVIDRSEVEGSPFREQRIRCPQRRMMNSQKALKLLPAILKC
jgi:hypothetical protein